jgi:hypothetical protein
MTATPYPTDSFGMQQFARRYAPSSTRLAQATHHAPGRAPAPACAILEEAGSLDDLFRIILAP